MKLNYFTIVVNIGIASVSKSILVRVLLVDVDHHGTVVTSVTLSVGAVRIGIFLPRVVHQWAVILARIIFVFIVKFMSYLLYV
jgi:hypothetical protein